MSVISFSGLATGLDTNSWVSALSALKNAKIEELQAERAAVVNIKDVVSGIKSYFTSFKSSLERLTDAKFKVDALDIFVQNLANSSDPSKVTATATSSASRDTYEVGVTQLATSTKVNSAYREYYIATYFGSTTSELTTWGVQEGYVSLNNKEFQIEAGETIGSLLEKLESIGIDAKYDDTKGRLSLETDIYESDQGATQLFDCLGLNFKTVKGLKSAELKMEGYVTIKPDTSLADIGVVGGDIMIDQALENIAFGADATVQDVLDWFNNKYGAGTAEMDAEGIITITGPDIIEITGGSNVLTGLGLVSTVNGVTSTSQELSHVQTEVAEWTTELGKLNTSFTNYNLVLGNGTTTQTVALGADKTLEDVKNAIVNYAAANGMNAVVEMEEDGSLTISGDIEQLYVSGGVATGLGFEYTSVFGTIMEGSPLDDYVLTTTATRTTTFAELGITGTDLNYKVLNERQEEVFASAVSGTMTLEQWFDAMKAHGVTATISETGAISAEGGIISGDLAVALGMGSVVSGSEVSKVTATSTALTGVVTVTATPTTTLGDLNITSNPSLTMQQGASTKTVNFNNNSTIKDVLDAVNAFGGTATFEDNVLKISGVDNISGTALTAFGLAESATGYSTTLSAPGLTYTTGSIATESSKFADYGVTTGNYNIYSVNGDLIAKDVACGATVSDFLAQMESYGLEAYIDSSGRINVSGGYITGTMANNLNITTETYKTVVTDVSQSSQQFHITQSTVATLGTALSQVGLSGGNITLHSDENTPITAYISTFADLQAAVMAAGGEFSMQDGIVTVSGVKITSGASSVGLAYKHGADETYEVTHTEVVTKTIDTIPTVIEQSLKTTTTTHTLTSSYSYGSGVLDYDITTTDIDPGSTKLSDMGMSGTVTITTGGILGTGTTATFGVGSNTVNDLLAWANTHGVEATFENGRFIFSANDDVKVSGGNMSLGESITKETYTRNSASKILDTTKTDNIIKGDTTLDKFTDNASERTLEVVVNGQTIVKSFAGSDDVNDVCAFLQAQGLTASITNAGEFKVSATYQEFSVGGELGHLLLGDNPAISSNSRTTEWTGRIEDYEYAATIDENTKIETLDVDLGSLKIYDNGTWINSAITMDENSTIGDLLNALAGYGFDATLAGGKITITADSDKYVANETSNFITKFGLSNRTTTEVNLYDQTNSRELTMTETRPVTGTSTLKELGFDAGASLRLDINGVMQTLGFTADETVQDVIDSIATYGIDIELDGNVLKASCETQTFRLLGTLADKIAGTSPNYVTTEKVLGYTGTEQNTDITYIADETAKLVDLGVSTGYFNVLKDDQLFSTVAIREDTTVGQLFSALAAYGVTGTIDADGVITVESIGNVTFLDGTSDLVTVFGLNDNIRVCSHTGTTMVLEEDIEDSSLDTLLSYYDDVDNAKFAEGSIYFDLEDQDGNLTQAVVNLEATDTIRDLLRKLEEVGISASYEDNFISYHYGLGTATITGGSSSFVDTLEMADADLETWMQNDDPIEYEVEEFRMLSICNYADDGTTLETLGITDGEFVIGVDGSLKSVNVSASDTIGGLIGKISAATGGAVTAEITDDGRFIMTADPAVELIVSSSTDTTNLATLFNLTQDGSNIIEGKTSLYKASSNSKITQGGAFRNGNVTAGTFSIGNATFTITGDTTIASLISDINHSEDAHANAYWDNINGKLVITSEALGSSYVNIAGGSSNFTDVFCLTTSDGGAERLVTYNQHLGDNAILTINDTRIVATSNTITSDISRIEGLTVNIKNVTPGETVTITVERDTQSIIDAVQETLDSYNALIAEVNSTLAIGGELHNDSALKSLKNQIASLMTSGISITGNQFRNLSAIGISTENASSALTNDIYSLYLDADKLEKSLHISEEDVKELLVGTEAAPGVLTKVENIIEQMLGGGGYFSSTTKSLNRKIANYDNKIERAKNSADQYKAILERKFHSMEQLYSNMQTSYKGLFAV